MVASEQHATMVFVHDCHVALGREEGKNDTEMLLFLREAAREVFHHGFSHIIS